MADITVLGAGGWGIAIAVLLNNNGHNVTIWSAVPREVEMLKTKRENEISLKGIKISEKIEITDDLNYAVKDKDILVLATASSYIRSTAHRLKGLTKPGQIIINVAKGIEDETFMTMTDIIESEIEDADVTVLSGPSHAEEVGRCLPTTCVVGAKTKETAQYIQNIFSSPVFRVYISPDILGIELGGALKNVIALAAGIADGLGYGDNTKAALITRGITEISRLGIKMGADKLTLYGLSGIGDLIVTCASMHSRNRRAGILIGQGYSMEDAMKEVNMVVEGVYCTKAAVGLARKYEVNMPIIEGVNKILFEGLSAKEAVNELMMRDKTIEHPELLW
ncbi:MAG: NAD(P)-dependent glycerol-3-phosphate dehydrogenase [Lachnospiraceae bacterium]|nr:NAD(P)-dependent glycerol-3-phosphate dehydrogenase [Lachnospiraceae bacterium]